MSELVIFEPSCKKESSTEGYPDFNNDGFNDLSHSEIVDSAAGGNTHCVEIGAASSSAGAWSQLIPHSGQKVVIAAQLPMSYDELNAIINEQYSPDLRQAVAALSGNKITPENISAYQQTVAEILNNAPLDSLVVNDQSRQKVLAFREADKVLMELKEAGSEIFVATGNTTGNLSSVTHFNIYALVPGTTVVRAPDGSLDNTLVDETFPGGISYQLVSRDNRYQLVPLNDYNASPILLSVEPSPDQIGKVFSFEGSSLSAARASE